MAIEHDPTTENEAAQKLLQYRLTCFSEPLMERWRECSYHGCKRRRYCMGGPRGTFKRFGKPVCMVGANTGDNFPFTFAAKVPI